MRQKVSDFNIGNREEALFVAQQNHIFLLTYRWTLEIVRFWTRGMFLLTGPSCTIDFAQALRTYSFLMHCTGGSFDTSCKRVHRDDRL
jgi:hypothetical protein